MHKAESHKKDAEKSQTIKTSPAAPVPPYLMLGAHLLLFQSRRGGALQICLNSICDTDFLLSPSAAAQLSAPPSPPCTGPQQPQWAGGVLLQPPKTGCGQHWVTLLREEGETPGSADHGRLEQLEEKKKDGEPGLFISRRAYGAEKDQKAAPEKE